MTLTPEEQSKETTTVNVSLTPLEQPLFTGLKLRKDIVLGDFAFNTIDEYGVVWVITDIQGWWQHPGADMPDIPRGEGDGSYDVEGRYKARELSLEGVFLTKDPALAEAARDRLIASTNLVYKGAWLKTGANPIKASWVRLSGDPDIQTQAARGRTSFSIPLRAPDPIKYTWNDFFPDGYDVVEISAKNPSAGLSGSGDLVNIGNYPVPVIFEVSGPLQGPATIYNRTTDELILITDGLKGTVGSSVENKQLSFNESTLTDIATLTTRTEHRFQVGDNIYVSGVGEPFDGDYEVKTVPTETTLTYEVIPSVADVEFVSHKSLSSGVATLETINDHQFSPGDTVLVKNVDSVFDGTYTVIDTPTTKSLTYQKTRVPPSTVTGSILVSNIATLTTLGDHQFIVGETVTVSGLGVNFDGSYAITSIPNSRQFRYAKTRTNANSIVQTRMDDDIVTVTTSAPHGFILDERVSISDTIDSLDGVYEIQSITSSTRFTYEKPRTTTQSVSVRAKTSGVVTLTTSQPHGFEVGETVLVSGIDQEIGSSAYDGSFTITSTPSDTSFTYNKSGGNELPTEVSNASVKLRSRIISNRSLTGNIATITTKNPHGILVGESITVTGINSTFNGTYTVTAVPSINTFTYTKTAANVPALTEEQQETFSGAIVSLSGDIASAVSLGTATVSGALPFSSVSGSASVSSNVARAVSAGNVIKKNDIQFTPGVEGGSIIVEADILEINTLNREVAFNGLLEGARAKIDVLANFMKMAPGTNIIEFEDNGNPESDANLKIYYRSGWLG